MLHLILIVMIAQILALMSPGPDFALVLKNSLLYSRRESLLTSLGVSLGIALHMTYCVYLLPFVIGNQEVIVSLVQYLGAAYLIYLGTLSIRSALGFYRLGEITTNESSPLSQAQSPGKNQGKSQPAYRFIVSGFLCNALNPKAILFFVSLFTAVITDEVPRYVSQICAIGFVLTTFTWFSCLSLLVTHKKYQRFFSSRAFKATTGLIAGVVLLLFALVLIVMAVQN